MEQNKPEIKKQIGLTKADLINAQKNLETEISNFERGLLINELMLVAVNQELNNPKFKTEEKPSADIS